MPDKSWGKVLIVDDDPVILMIHRLKVMKSGLDKEPMEFLNGKPALDYLMEHQTNGQKFLVLLDINMPVMNGWEFLEALEQNQLCNKVDVAIVTSSVNHEDKKRAENFNKVFSYLIKPLGEDDLQKL